MRITHLISDLSRINFGIWNAALSTSAIIKSKYNWKSEAWSPPGGLGTDVKGYSVASKTIDNIPDHFEEIDGEDGVFVSHGTWTWATKTGCYLKKEGYKWIAVPHGMLEPWSMEHKKWKKKIYFSLFEKRMLSKADAIVAVGLPEYENLKRIFGDKVVRIPNGISPFKGAIKKQEGKRIFLFMGRLHHKKGVLPLVQAWLKSSLVNDPTAELWIAGPDEGEREKVDELLEKVGRSLGTGRWSLGIGQNSVGDRGRRVSIKILGAVYGEEKEEVLKEAHFFVLPSQSEGFPTSIIESMTYGCVPIITEGCNFPEAVDNGVAIKTFFDVSGIEQSLKYAFAMTDGEISERSYASKYFADNHYNLEKVAEQQYELYKRVLKGVLS